MCNKIHPLYVALSVSYVIVLVARGDFVSYRQYVSLGNDFGDLELDCVGLVSFKKRTNALLLSQDAHSIFVYYCFLFHFFLSMRQFYMLVLQVSSMIQCFYISLTPSLALPIFFSTITTTTTTTASSTSTTDSFCRFFFLTFFLT